MSESHGASKVHDHGSSEGPSKGSFRRILIVALIMLSVAILSFVPSLYRGSTGITSTATDSTPLFIPVWLTLTVGVVLIAFYFFKDLVTKERARDGETPRPAEPVHSH